MYRQKGNQEYTIYYESKLKKGVKAIENKFRGKLLSKLWVVSKLIIKTSK